MIFAADHLGFFRIRHIGMTEYFKTIFFRLFDPRNTYIYIAKNSDSMAVIWKIQDGCHKLFRKNVNIGFWIQ